VSSLKIIIIACAARGILIETSAQWIQIPSSPAGFFRNIVNVNDTLYASHSNTGIYISSDGTTSWQQINSGLNNTESRQVSEVIKFNSDLYAATVDGIYKSTNGGAEWIKKSDGITIGPGALKEFCESIFEFEGVLFTGAFNGIYRSENGAESWTVTNVSSTHVLAKNFTNHNGILFAARESINTPNGYKSSDNGLTWEVLTGMNFPSISFLSEFPNLWMGTIHGIWLSTDNGNNWEQRSEGLSTDPYNTSIIRVNGKLVTSLHFGGSGIFISEDEGLSWEDFGQGLPFLSNIEKLIVYEDKIIAATSSGLWQRDTSGVISALEEQTNLPQEFKLFQNFPNPFNSTTKIKFTLTQSLSLGERVSEGRVRAMLKVYDILGREVATLVNEEMPAGSYEIEFDAAELTSGIYFYRLMTDNFSETRKMLVVK